MTAALAGCAGLSGTFDVEPFLREQITGDTWRACLAREYQRQTRVQLRSGRDWGAATRMAVKGRAALDGEEVLPEPAAPEMVPAMPALEAALARRSENPCDCAVVQGKYDSWAVTVSRKLDTGPIRAAFDNAVKACTAPR